MNHELDEHIRAHTLRVSVLEHCQLRCGYCLPDAKQNFLHKKYWLQLKDYQKIASALRCLALAKIRFTGGEPLLRFDLVKIIEIFAQSFPHTPLALTTNGLRLEAKLALELKKAGLSSMTFHVDSLSHRRYEKLMGKGNVDRVLEAIKHAKDLGFNVKINTVVQKNLNDDELIDFLKLSKKISTQVRFIEIMNTGSALEFVKSNFIAGHDILALIAKRFNFSARPRENLSDPAQLYYIDELDLCFGLIASDTQPFCKHCTRLRLSADGKLHTCLYDNEATQLNLKDNEESLQTCIKAKIARKVSLHPAMLLPRRIFSMSQTGG